jgi:hypothetical protein
VCKQKLHLDWWFSWEIREANVEMKKLVEEMCLDDLQKDMATNIMEAARSGLDVKSDGEYANTYSTKSN